MTFKQAAQTQYLRSSLYTVWLVSTDGSTRVSLGSTSSKSGRGLLGVVGTPYVQKAIGEHLDASVTITKRTAAAILLSNGWRVEFGGTIRQESHE